MPRTPDTPLDAIYFWLTPALSSAERILRHDKRYYPWRTTNDLTSEEASEAAILLLTLRNLERAIQWAADDLGPEARNVIDQFHALLPGLTQSRNALEHFDEYAVGRGRHQRSIDSRFDFEFSRDPRPVVRVGPASFDVERVREATRWLVISVLALHAEAEERAT